MTRGGAVVTGASSGIGAAIAHELAARGFTVFGTIRRPEDGAALVAAGVTPIPMDVTDASGIAAARAVIFSQMVDDPSEYVEELLGDPALEHAAQRELGERLDAWTERAMSR